jgi:hypothetical protein
VHLTRSHDKVYQLLAHGQWFSLGTPASSTTKIGRHDIAELLLKMVKHQKSEIKINHSLGECWYLIYWFNPSTFSCLSQARTWISHAIYKSWCFFYSNV